MPCSSSSRVTKNAALSMQSRERLLTPLLKYFALALAHGILRRWKWRRTLQMHCDMWDLNNSGFYNRPVSSSQGPEFGFSFTRRCRVIKNPLDLEFNLSGRQESACLVHPEPKVATSVINGYVVAVLPVLHSVFRQKREKRQSREESKYLRVDGCEKLTSDNIISFRCL